MRLNIRIVTALWAFACTVASAGPPPEERAGAPALAQKLISIAVPQITQAVDPRRTTPLRTNVRAEATPANDRGELADATPMSRLSLVLHRPEAAQQALDALMAAQTNPASSDFHRWLTADEVGAYGAAQSDIDTLTAWLGAQGFRVDRVHADRTVIEFSGNAGQVRAAFGTEIHQLDVDGVLHIANMSVPQIPQALAPAVIGIAALHDFHPHAQIAAQPNYTIGSSQAVVPDDLHTIYHLGALYAAGIDGSGQTIVLLEDQDPYNSVSNGGVWSNADVDGFRAAFGLPAFSAFGPTYSEVHPGCGDPGTRNDGEDLEAAADIEWAGAAAPHANLVMASCDSGVLNAMNGLNSANDAARLWSISFGVCEAWNGEAFNAALSNAYQTAAARGVSVFVSSGDSGAAGCNPHVDAATRGIAVSAWAATNYNVAVGGTDFGDAYAGTTPAYWSSANSSTFGSAISYVNEIAWNDSCASQLLANGGALFAPFWNPFATTYGSAGLCNDAAFGTRYFLDASAGGGGPSNCHTGVAPGGNGSGGTCAGLAKPDWQSGVSGNPNDGVRDIPDVSLFAADGTWGHYFVFCWSNPNDGGSSCTGAPNSWTAGGGTSVSAPVMVGIQALVNQKQALSGASNNGAQGNPNPAYYALAASQFGGSAHCDATLGNAIDPGCIFHDVTQGDIDVDCAAGSNNCFLPSGTYGVLSTSNVAYQPSYRAGPGWDFATGLGSIDAANLVNHWFDEGSTRYTIGGRVSGLTAAGLVLAVTAGNQTVSVPAGAVAYVFPVAQSANSAYSVSVQTQPSGQTCTVLNASGTVQRANVTDASVVCSAGATQLSFATEPPSSWAAGANFTVRAAIEDSSGNVVATDSSTVTLALTGGNASARLTGSIATAVNGIATFTLSVDTAGSNYRLNATDATLATASSNAFNIAPSAIITTVVGTGSNNFGAGDGGPATNATLANTHGVSFDAAGNMYVADSADQRIRKVDATGLITTVAGNGTATLPSGDGGLATGASVIYPDQTAFDAAGNMYIIEPFANRIRKVNASTGIISTIAGTTVAGFSGDGGPATSALLNTPQQGIAVDKQGNVYFSDTNNARIRRIDATSGIITTIAGNGQPGHSGDGGAATSATLNAPLGMTFDAAGNLYFADTNNNCIREIDTSGVITTIAGTGSVGYSGDGGPATAATLNSPDDVKFDPLTGSLYFSDLFNEVVREIDANGIITTVAGSGVSGFFGDGGAATQARLNKPAGIAVDATGNVYVADSSNFRIRRISFNFMVGGTISGLSGSGLVLGLNIGNQTLAIPAGATRYAFRMGVPIGTTYALSVLTQPAGQTCVVSNASGTIGSGDVSNANVACSGPAAKLMFIASPSGSYGSGQAFGATVAVQDSAGNLVLSDSAPVALTLTGGTGGAILSGTATVNAVNGIATFNGLAVNLGGSAYALRAAQGTLPTTTSGTFNIVADRIITTAAGSANSGFSGDGGPASNAGLSFPESVVFDQAGNLYIADYSHDRIRKVNTAGIISTVAGNGSSLYSGDNGPATSAGLDAIAVAIDTAGNLYLADYPNNRVRKVDVASGLITTIAGNGSAGFFGDGGTATSAEIWGPEAVAVDAAGNVYIADTNNQRVRKVDTSGNISTIAGTGTAGLSGDNGPGVSGNINLPRGLLLDAAGNLYIADALNHRIRKLTPAGTISTFAGTTGGFSGDGGPASAAQFNRPYGLTYDAAGNMYVAEYAGQRVRKIDTGGIISTIAGNGSQGYSGDGGPALQASLNNPISVAVNVAGDLYIADSSNQRVRTLAQSYFIGGTISGLNGSVTLQLDGTSPASTQTQTVSASGNFSFGGALRLGSGWIVSIAAQPTDQLCSVTTHGSGTNLTTNVVDVGISCVNNVYTIGGSVSSLSAAGLVLALNAGNQTVTVASGANSYVFGTAQAAGTPYVVSVQVQPLGQTCTIANASGTLGSANVTNANVSCTINLYTIGGNVVGASSPVGLTLTDSTHATTQNLSSNGAFAFPLGLPYGTNWNVTVTTTPSGQSCTIDANGVGNNLTVDITNIMVNCSGNQTLTFSAPPANASVGGATYALSATSSAGLIPVVLRADPSSARVCALSGGSTGTGVVSFIGAGTCKIDASQAGDSTRSAAVASQSFPVTTGAPAKLAFTQQPGDGVAGVALSPVVTVSLEDVAGDVVTNGTHTVSLTVAGPGPFDASSTTSASFVNGIATFSNLKFDMTGSGYTLTATDAADSLSTASVMFSITNAAAVKLAFVAQPSTAIAGVALSPAVAVAIEDAFGNVVAANTHGVSITVSGPGQFDASSVTSTNFVGGVATFANLKFDTAGSNYKLTATDASDALSVDSAPFSIAPAAMSQLAFTQQPGSGIAGVALGSAVLVAAEDAFGNVVTSNTHSISMSVSGPGPFDAASTTIANLVSGVAVFSNLRFDIAGSGYKLTATDASDALSVDSTNFLVIATAASKIVFSTQPSNGTAGVALSPAVTVVALDQFDNVVKNDARLVSVSVTGPGPFDAASTTSKTFVSGVATFTNLKLDVAGSNYTLTATDASESLSANSVPFSIVAAAAASVLFTAQPGNGTAGMALAPAVTLAIQDGLGNVVPSNTHSVALSVSGPGSFDASSTTTATFVNGIATFANLKFDTAGSNYTLTATDTADALTLDSASFAIAAAPAAKLVFTTPPGNGTAGVTLSPAVAVTVEDSFGNVAASNTHGVSMSVAGPGPFAASSTTTSAFVNGVAAFANITLNVAGANYTLTATDGADALSVDSAVFAIAAGAETLVFTRQPANFNVGNVLGSMQVTAKDALGNVVADNGSVDFTIVACGGTISVGSAIMMNGVANLNSVQHFYTPATGLSLVATRGTLHVTSATFDVVRADDVFNAGFESCRL